MGEGGGLGAGASRTHVVRPGETLSSIAQKNGLSWHALARANHILRPDELRAGTTLRIPAPMGGSVPKSPLPPPPPLPGPPGGPLPPTASPRLGDLSMRYETSFRPGQEAEAAGVVSTGVSDPGGVSYGAYQLASSAKGGHQVQAFLCANGLPWAARFASKDPTTAAGDFAKTWHEVAGKEGMVFFWRSTPTSSGHIKPPSSIMCARLQVSISRAGPGQSRTPCGRRRSSMGKLLA